MVQLSGLHAKTYVFERGKEADVWTGSANCTDAAFHHNVEFMVRLTGQTEVAGKQYSPTRAPSSPSGAFSTKARSAAELISAAARSRSVRNAAGAKSPPGASLRSRTTRSFRRRASTPSLHVWKGVIVDGVARLPVIGSRGWLGRATAKQPDQRTDQRAHPIRRDLRLRLVVDSPRTCGSSGGSITCSLSSPRWAEGASAIRPQQLRRPESD